MAMPTGTRQYGTNTLEMYAKLTEEYLNSFKNNITPSPYYGSAESLISTDSVVSPIYKTIVDILVPDGFAWEVNGEFRKMGEDFKRLTDTHWKKFVAHAIRFHLCYGFFIWAAGTDTAGYVYPFVPEIKHLDLMFSNDKDGVSCINAAWKDKEKKSRLYVIYRRYNAYGATNETPMSVINSILPQLDFMYRTIIDRISIGHHLAEPPLILVHNNAISGAAGMNNNGIASVVAGGGTVNNVQMMRNALIQTQFLEQDRRDTYREAQMNRVTSHANQGVKVMSPAMRMNYAISQPYEKNPHMIPYGLNTSQVALPSTDLNFIATVTYHEGLIFDAFGITKDHQMRASTFNHWVHMLSELITNTYRILYNKDSLALSDVKATHASDNKKYIKKTDEFGHEQFFEVDEDDEVDCTYGYLMSHVRRDIDMATNMKKNGLMSEELYLMLFPHLREEFAMKREREFEMEKELVTAQQLQKTSENSANRQHQTHSVNLNKRSKITK